MKVYTTSFKINEFKASEGCDYLEKDFIPLNQDSWKSREKNEL